MADNFNILDRSPGIYVQTPARISGSYAGPRVGNSGTGIVTVANTIIYIPWNQLGGAIDRIGAEITSLVNPSTVRLGVALADPVTGLPSAVLLDAGTIDGASTGAKEITVSAVLPPGLVWLMVKAETGTPSLRGLNAAGSTTQVSPDLGSPTLATSLTRNTAYTCLTEADAPAGAFVAPGTLAGATPFVHVSVRWV